MAYMLRTAVLLGLLTGILLFIGHLIGGQTGVVIAFIIAAVMNFMSYWFSDKIVLSMYGAKATQDSGGTIQEG